MKKIITLFFIFIFSINSITLAYYPDTEYVWSENIIPTNAENTSEDFLELTCESAILVEQTTGKILYDKASHTELRPASVTKIMTILLIMEEIENGNLSYDTKITCSETAAALGGSQIWLETGETLTVDEMLKAICIVSANDCCVAMAEHIAGSEIAFVDLMNQKAKDLGMKNTTFKNCHGIDEDGHITSSYDISLMSCELLNKYPEITNYTTIWMDSLRNGESELVNTNKLIKVYEGATGLKTGSTSLALYNLSASATRENLSLVAVIMRAPSSKERVSNARKLLDYGFANYEYISTSTQNEAVKNIPISKGIKNNIDLVCEKSTGCIIKKGDTSEITNEIILNNNISAPIKKNQKLGKINFYLNDELIASTNLISNENIKKKTTLNIFKHVTTSWSNLLR